MVAIYIYTCIYLTNVYKTANDIYVENQTNNSGQIILVCNNVSDRRYYKLVH